MSAEIFSAIENCGGVPSRYIDETTVRLNILAASFEDVQQGRIRASNRGDEYSTDALQTLEDSLAHQLTRTLRTHDLWPFLKPLKGLAGARTARVIAAIGDPRRFPGQLCTEGHHMPVGLFAVGDPCPVEEVPTTEFDDEIEARRGGGEVDHADDANVSEEKSGVDDPTEGNTENEIPVGGVKLNHADVEHEFGTVAGVDDPTEDGREIESLVGGVEVSPGSTDRSTEIETSNGRCPGVMLPPRSGTGARSIRHYFGLHVVDGHAPRRRKGVQADWNTKALTLVLGPNGIADQIVRHRTPGYRELYDRKKAAQLENGKRPIQAERAARRYASQEFLADLLIEWKRVS